MTAAGATARRRGRPSRTYEAVLRATTELLQDASLAELSVARILAAAGVSRTSFYEHFASKDDVVVQLMRRISFEVGEEIEPMFERGERSPDEAIREGVRNSLAICSRYASLLAAMAEEWPAVPALRALWLAMLGEATSRLAEMIERDRAAGLAPPGAAAEPLAASLVWTAERSMHIALTGASPALADEASLVDPLVQLFVGTIYGRAVSPERTALP